MKIQLGIYTAIFRSGGVVLFLGDTYIDWFESLMAAEEWIEEQSILV